jgi:hypothetical protein
LELAIEFLATVAAEACRSGGDRLHLAIAGRDAWCTSGVASSGMLSEILYRLAVAEGGDGGATGDAYKLLTAARWSGRNALLVSTRAIDPAHLERSIAREYVGRGANGDGGPAALGRKNGEDGHPFARKMAVRWMCLEAGSDSLSAYFQAGDAVGSRPEVVAP